MVAILAHNQKVARSNRAPATKGELYLQFYGDSLSCTSNRMKQVRQFAISEDGQRVANDALRRIGLEE